MDPMSAYMAYIVFRQEQQVTNQQRGHADERRGQLAQALAAPFRRVLRGVRAPKGRRPASARDTLGWARTVTGRRPFPVAVLPAVV